MIEREKEVDRHKERGKKNIAGIRNTCFDLLTWKMYVFSANPKLSCKVKLLVFSFCLSQ